MKNKVKWSSICVVIILLTAYTHCDLMLAPQNGKINHKKNRSTASVTTTTTSDSPDVLSTPSTDYANAYSFYEDVVAIKIKEQNCLLCHSSNGGAPLSIVNYDDLKELLLNGKVLAKMTGSQAHGGGVKCSDSNTGICKSFSEWYSIEFSQNNQEVPAFVPSNSQLIGSIDSISAMGKVVGHVGNPSNPNNSLTVDFYLDGPKGSGEFIGSSLANLPGGSVAGNHGFIFFVPSEYRDGSTHLIYSYVEDESLSGGGKTFSAYSPSIEGFEYYQSNVKPILDNRCSRCHAVNYDQHFNSLLTPAPSFGGSPTNNEMINMPTGSHGGVNHPGGNLCGNKNSSPCLEIQTWWGIEFNK